MRLILQLSRHATSVTRFWVPLWLLTACSSEPRPDVSSTTTTAIGGGSAVGGSIGHGGESSVAGVAASGGRPLAPGTGGAGGSTGGSSIAVAKGGSTAGELATGGTSAAGAPEGGVANGGRATGGADPGGTASGGRASGGAATGGRAAGGVGGASGGEPPVGSPVWHNGRLKVVGSQLVNECGKPVQLKGMGSHGLMWFPKCYTEESFAALAKDWGIDIFEIKINYTLWYEKDPTAARQFVDGMVNTLDKLGIYSIIQLVEGDDPPKWVETSKQVLQYFSATHKNKKSVLYQPFNEPLPAATWKACKESAEKVIPTIRANDPEGIIIVPTPDYCQRVDQAADDPITGANAYNILYNLHFYAASHKNVIAYFNYASNKIPIIAAEWGVCTYTGSGELSTQAADDWTNMLAGSNPGKQLVSWCNHSYADNYKPTAAVASNGSCGALVTGSCAAKTWSNTSPSGTYIKAKILESDNWTSCR